MKRILGTAKGQKTRCRRESMLLYAVTDRTWLGDATLAEQVGAAIKGGVTFIQFREKYLDKEAFIREAKEIREVCRNYQVPFVINDHADIAAAIDADGVHVGQKDIDALDARRILGEDKIIGVTARTVEQALRAQEHGADYLGVGAVFQTDTKADAVEVKRDTVKAICEAVDIPVIAIGGIGEDNVLQLAGNGLCGIAVVSALFARPDIEQAARNLKRLSEKMVNQ
ncbi:thiamine phosphate synthase [Clostridium sp. AF19-22AC]|jgi:thiamine-phosphate pyrophosphorylase|uniref:thiamine phosphate synthase n=1 Tax=Clostridia TaxID=186801 RepID=UPI000E4E7B9B|nr:MULTISPECIES: thiamine phosphate synthase [Clostridia]RHR27638.1 thiamine phosphate synthase [Clostridium sp. AF19-22AC]